ncbi:MAG: hypothetical protein TH68_09085 [Candidatus Synechococcus spongiarum 142]|uniref:Uncharacterized protein n=1 Tax=Candidatus Synechococcus spongiarum 142 TaxID=1608213 RepID=A0A6N3X321_9SYNE|nr:MAG: hypothetical protein TH68_09085 [Candidatus Synechococcus spongiarum 142]
MAMDYLKERNGRPGLRSIHHSAAALRPSSGLASDLARWFPVNDGRLEQSDNFSMGCPLTMRTSVLGGACMNQQAFQARKDDCEIRLAPVHVQEIINKFKILDV